MAQGSKTYFLYCEACDFQQDVAQILPRTPFATAEELVKEVHRFHCSVCGNTKVVLRQVSA